MGVFENIDTNACWSASLAQRRVLFFLLLSTYNFIVRDCEVLTRVFLVISYGMLSWVQHEMPTHSFKLYICHPSAISEGITDKHDCITISRFWSNPMFSRVVGPCRHAGIPDPKLTLFMLHVVHINICDIQCIPCDIYMVVLICFDVVSWF